MIKKNNGFLLLRITTILGLCFLHLVNRIFISSSNIELVETFLAVAIVFLTLPVLTGRIRFLTWSIFLLGSILLVVNKAPFEIWAEAFRTNTDLITIIVFTPLFGIAVEQGHYKAALAKIYRRVVHRGDILYLYNNLMSFFLSLILNIGALPLVHAISPVSNADNKDIRRILCTSLGRGFYCALAISPNFANLGLITRSLNLSWLDLVKVGIGLPLIMFAIGYLTIFRADSKIVVPSQKETGRERNLIIKIMELAIFLTLSLALVILIQSHTRWSILTVVPLVAIFISFLWIMVSVKSIILYHRCMADFINCNIDSMKDIIALFLGAGFLAVAIKSSGLGDHLLALVNTVGGGAPLLISLFLSSTIMCGSLVGVHPLISINVILTVINPTSINISPVFLSLALLIGSTLGSVMSPFSGYNMVLASLFHESLFKVSISWNIFYVSLSFLVMIAYLNLLAYMALI